MGSKNSKNTTKKTVEDKMISTNDYETTNNSETNSRKTTISNSIDTEKIKENANIMDLNERIPYKFIWKKNAENVYIIGDFLNNWKSLEKMEKNAQTGFFEYLIYLNKKTYLFKFVVNGNWIYSEDYNIHKDNYNNINNIIDLTNSSELSMSNCMNIADINSKNKDISINNCKESNITLKKKIVYDSVIPKNNELNLVPASLHSDYKSKFTLDSIYQNSKNNTSETSYKIIEVCPHEKLLHFSHNLINDKKVNDRYIKVTTSYRIKHKFLTIIYCHPSSKESMSN